MFKTSQAETPGSGASPIGTAHALAACPLVPFRVDRAATIERTSHEKNPDLHPLGLPRGGGHAG
jgi:hypothetical protein